MRRSGARSPDGAARELTRHVAIGLGFGLAWAAVQYVNGQIRDVAALAGPVLVFGLAGIATWLLRRAARALRRR